MPVPVMLIGAIIIIILGIVIFAMTDPFELIALGGIGALIFGMYMGVI